MIRTALLIGTLVLLAGCNRPPNDPESGQAHDPLVLEVYPAGPGMAERIESSLAYLLSGRDTRVGRVTTLPNGHIAVSAPASMQSGIAALIDEIVDTGPAATRQVRIRQWLIEATAAEQTSVPDNLASLEAELRDFTSSVGAMTFERLDRAEHVMRDGKRSILESKLLNSSFSTRIQGDRILVDVHTSAPMLGRLNTEFSAQTGQNLIMAQLEKVESDEQAAGSMILFVVRAEIL